MRRHHFILATALLVTGVRAQPATQTVDVVGTRVPRVDAETALPLQIIRRDEIERSGASTAEELLERVSAAAGGFRQAMGLGNSDSPGQSAASLRGFGAGETLVLLNGRRLANYAFTGAGGPSVDLHILPMAAIDRVEILRDGASALYGSDAVAGVINFVTRQAYTGADASIAIGQAEAGGGGRARATVSLGLGSLSGDDGNAFFVLDLQRTQRLRASDREFASTSYRPELGLDGTLPPSFPANIILLRNGRRSLLNPVAPACPERTVLLGRACWFDPASALDLTAPSQQVSLLGRGSLPLASGAVGYAEMLAAASRIRFEASPTPLSFLTSSSGLNFVLPASSPYYPAGLGLDGPLQLAYRTAPLGGRTRDVASDNLRLLAGVRTQWTGWEVDAALGFNDTQARERFVRGYVAARSIAEALASGLLNPFGTSDPPGQALLAAAELKGDSRRAAGRTYGVDLRVNREWAGPGGAVGLAAGLEARRESLRDEQFQLVADVGGESPPAPKKGQRSVQAAYVELVAPLARAVELQAAARLDHYSDFGSSINPKLALRVQPLDGAVLRASLGRGFRAPSLPELYTQSRTLPLFTDTPDPVRCPVTGLASDCQLAVSVTAGGNAALKPQRSVQASLGFVFEPARGALASLDVWSIRIRDIIGVQDVDRVLGDLTRYEGRNVVRGAPDAEHPTLPGPVVGLLTLNENLGDWRVDGADLALSVRGPEGAWGRASARVDATYIRQARQNIVAGNPIDLIGRVAPRLQTVLTMNLDHQAWAATLAYRYRRGYPDAVPLPDDSVRRVASYQVWDAQLAHALTPDTRLSLGVRNLLDRAPPFSNQSASFQAGYDPSYADPLGRTWTLTLRHRWPR